MGGPKSVKYGMTSRVFAKDFIVSRVILHIVNDLINEVFNVIWIKLNDIGIK